MHRSGTSAIAGALRLFGLRARPEDRDCAPENGRGHFESRALSSFDERLLNALGGSWDRPPRLTPGWEQAPELEESRRLALDAFRVEFGSDPCPVVFTDARLSLLLPFWREVLGRPLVAVLACRNPLEVAASLQARDGLRPAVGLALWDRYQRSALEAARGLPLFVTHFEQLLDHRERWTGELRAFLGRAGVRTADPDPDGLLDWLDPALRRQPSAAAGPGSLLPAQAGLCQRLESLAGPHQRFMPPRLEAADEWTSELLEARSDAAAAWKGLLWAAGLIEEHAAKPIAAVLGVSSPAVRKDPPTAPPYPANATEDGDAYLAWRAARGLATRIPGKADVLAGRGLPRPRTRAPEVPPRFSVVVPVFGPPVWVLQRCVASVLAQTFPSFELCLCDDGSESSEITAVLDEIARLDPRVKVTALPSRGGISAATNHASSLACGEFVVFLDHDDELEPQALEFLAEAAEAEPAADVLYSDEDKTDETGALFAPAFKPDWAPDILLSTAYLCHVLVVRRSLVQELGGLRSEFDGSQDYDLMLRATERARSIVHVPEVLYHWRVMAGSAAGATTSKPWAYEAGRRAVEDAVARRGEDAVVESTVVPGLYHVRRRVRGEALLSVIVPFRDDPALLSQCVDAVLSAGGYEHVELVLVDNGSVLPETGSLLDRLAEDPRIVLLEEPGPYSWSGINNAAAREVSGDLLLFLNNDIEAITRGWLSALVEHAQREEVGAVGGRLLYPDRTVQHVGVVIGMSNGAAHVLQGLPADSPGYLSWAYMTRDCSAVTGACLMTRRDIFESIDGFSEDLPVAFSDVDYCLRLRRSGRLVVYTPLAELVHHESRTRGHADDALELPRLIARWAGEIAQGDPYYSPHLSLWRPWCPLSTPEEDEQWTTFRSKLKLLQS
jgi:GT2 family glycosyltransferase